MQEFMKKKSIYEKLFFFKLKYRNYNFSMIFDINFLLRYLLHMVATMLLTSENNHSLKTWVTGIARYYLVTAVNIGNRITLYFHQSIMSVRLDTISSAKSMNLILYM